MKVFCLVALLCGFADAVKMKQMDPDEAVRQMLRFKGTLQDANGDALIKEASHHKMRQLAVDTVSEAAEQLADNEDQGGPYADGSEKPHKTGTWWKYQVDNYVGNSKDGARDALPTNVRTGGAFDHTRLHVHARRTPKWLAAYRAKYPGDTGPGKDFQIWHSDSTYLERREGESDGDIVPFTKYANEMNAPKELKHVASEKEEEKAKAPMVAHEKKEATTKEDTKAQKKEARHEKRKGKGAKKEHHKKSK